MQTIVMYHLVVFPKPLVLPAMGKVGLVYTHITSHHITWHDMASHDITSHHMKDPQPSNSSLKTPLRPFQTLSKHFPPLIS